MIIAVTGGTGRTTTALGLAAAASATGQDTILVDGDSFQHDAEAALRSVTAMAKTLNRTPPLRVLPLSPEETTRWVTTDNPRADQVTILDLPRRAPDDVLGAVDAVLIPLKAGDMVGVHRAGGAADTRFRMVATENGAPCFALIHSDQLHFASRHAGDGLIQDERIQLLDARVPHSIEVKRIAGSPWGSNWSLFAALFAPSWEELRGRLGLPVPAQSRPA
ncbi:hypothetical protein [Streptomyces sp. NPDC058268]|uniref:hypothetical protein n=1 Tax=Streptomyces sp. NPDC058268 TaxID=3346413 RepID=UPI0036E77479